MYYCIQRKMVRSAYVYAVGYDEDDMVLEVELRDGSVLQFMNVPELHHRGLVRASSIGEYYRAYVDGQFPCRRVR